MANPDTEIGHVLFQHIFKTNTFALLNRKKLQANTTRQH